MIYVCSLARLHQTVNETKASHVLTLIKDIHLVTRPASIPAERHLMIDMDDICDPLDGYILPAEQHVADLLAFARNWDRAAPLVVHCYAGISRSTAGAFTIACALNPDREEASIARAIREASPTASPNMRIVTLADAALGRNGRMIAAIAAIGPGIAATQATPFRITID